LVIIPVGAIAIAGTIAYFYVPGVREGVTNSIYQAGLAASTMFARSPGVQVGDRAANEAGLDKEARREVHDDNTRQGLNDKEWMDEAQGQADLDQATRDLKEAYKNVNKKALDDALEQGAGEELKKFLGFNPLTEKPPQ
jgi:hypothetical protein